MDLNKTPHQLPAPCIIEFGTIVNKEDIRRLLNDLGRVRYIHSLDGKACSEGEGWVLEVFSDPNQATIVANGTLYINIQSFDYLQLYQSSEKKVCFDLIQDNRQLRLVPISNVSQQETAQNLDEAALEAMVTQVLSAQWDVQLDDDDCPF